MRNWFVLQQFMQTWYGRRHLTGLCERCQRARLAWDMLAPPVPSMQERKIFSSVSEYKTVASSVCLPSANGCSLG